MNLSSTWNVRTLADGLGLIGATACALHCIAIPVLLVTGSAVPTVFLSEAFHQALLWWVIPSALLAFTLGCRRHKDRRVFLFGAIGMIGLVLAVTVLHELMGEAAEKIATLVSAGFLVTAHIRNYKLCREDSCPDGEMESPT